MHQNHKNQNRYFIRIVLNAKYIEIVRQKALKSSLQCYSPDFCQKAWMSGIFTISGPFTWQLHEMSGSAQGVGCDWSVPFVGNFHDVRTFHVTSVSREESGHDNPGRLGESRRRGRGLRQRGRSGSCILLCDSLCAKGRLAVLFYIVLRIGR